MKSAWAVLGLLAAMAQGQETGWRYQLPDTGILPSYYAVEATSSMGARHGGSSLGWQRYALCIPFADPRRSGWGDWYINVSLEGDVTVLHPGGDLRLRRRELTNFTLPLAFIRPDALGNRWLVALAPSIASDGVHVSHSLDVGGLVGYHVRQSETLSYSLGIGAAPRYVDHYVLPYLTLEWQMSDRWLLKLERYRVDILRRLSDHAMAGFFAQGVGGSWTVDTPRGKMLFRTRSLVAGVAGEYDFSRPGQTKRIISFSLGSTLATTAEFCRRNAGHEVQWSAHYHPGLYVAAQVDFRF